jgi:hypothetical protein
MSRTRPKVFVIRSVQLAPMRTRLFIADYIVDLHQRNDVTYYAISRNGSNDIVSMGHETTYEEAERSARWTVSQQTDSEAPSLKKQQTA